MEYVEGEPIHHFCNTRCLTIGQRLELYRQVCAAVHYAHQNLIVHRDLKPDNIIVTPAGVPKLLDFGIAKILKPEMSPVSMGVTKEQAWLMTPAYASPEQIRGGPITTASDVYSLGVLLYELLTGHRPFRLASRTPREIERLICEQQPERPSTVITRLEETEAQEGGTTTLTPEIVSKTREGQPDKLRRRLLGDLDNIVLMAIRKEPQRRYASVEQFSEDILRHLNGLPVIARPSTFRYHSAKFITRHKIGVLSAAVIVMLLLGGIIATFRQAHIAEIQRVKAEHRFNDVRQLANSLMFEIHDAIADLSGSTAARELLVSRALEYLDVLATQSEDDSSLQLELSWAYKKIGDVQGNPNNANLGDVSGALASYNKGIALAEELVVANPQNMPALKAQAVIYEKLSDVQSWTGDVPEAIASSQKSLEIFTHLAAMALTDRESQSSLAISHIKLGDILGNPNFPNIGKSDDAMHHYQQALSILGDLEFSHGANLTTLRYLGLSQERIGTIFELQSNFKKALESYQESLSIRQRLVREKPAHYDMNRDLAIAFEKIADIHQRTGNNAAALESYHKSLAIFERLASKDPENTNAQRSLSFSYEHTAHALEAQGQFAHATSYYEKALRIRQDLRKNDPMNRKDRSDLGGTLFRLADLSARQGNVGAAERYSRKLLQLQQEQADNPQATVFDLNNYAWSLLTCQPVALRDPALALEYANKAVKMPQGEAPNILDTLALAYFMNGHLERAVETEEKALSLVPANSPMRHDIESNLRRFLSAIEEK